MIWVELLKFLTRFNLINMARRLPLVIILGATGTGKTKLSIELAHKLGGEIIGADSMQVYKGLDIITAKATKQEQSLAQHHLIDILEPHDTFSVIEFRKRALNVINDLFSKCKLPVVVGGTNYYIESILWKILIDNPEGNFSDIPGILPNNEHTLSSEELHKKLKLLDPAMARRLHPNNKRKILRSLEILYQKGKKHSDLIEEQHKSGGGCRTGGGLRFPNSIILWLKCEQAVHDKRLDDRVDNMIEDGLLIELSNFHKSYNQHRISTDGAADCTRGVFQSIGFKEFHSYLMLPDEERGNGDGVKKLNEGIEQLKMVTRRYARKQNKWIKNRFLGRTDRNVPPVYGLDTTDVSKWNENVLGPAVQIVESFIEQKTCNYERLPFESSNSTPNVDHHTYLCEVCDRVFVGEFQWTVHLKSHRHKKVMESKNRKKRMVKQE